MKKISLFLTVLTFSTLLSACGNTPVANTPQSPDTSTPTKTEAAPKTVAQSLKDLISSGLAQKCTWTLTDDQSQNMTGTLLINGKKFKQTSTSTVNGKPMETNVISDGQWTYTWTSLSPSTGFKMKLDDTQAPGAAPTGGQSQKVDLDKKIDYQCSPSTLSDADLAVPSDITFTDFSATIKNLQNGKMDLEQIKKLQEQYSK